MPYMNDNTLQMAPIISDSDSKDQDLLEPIAVTGFSLRMPQDAEDPQAFWQLLEEKKCTMTEWPKDRMNIDAFYHPDHDRHDTVRPCQFIPPYQMLKHFGQIYARGGHFLRGDLASFDAPFFSISGNEAAAMDPQQRILLETSYRALENGRYQFQGQLQRVTLISRHSWHSNREVVRLQDRGLHRIYGR